MKHNQFLSKIAHYKAIYDYAVGEKKDLKDTASKFDMMPAHVVIALNYYERHKADVQCPAMGHLTHYSVLKLAYCGVDLSSLESMRKGLLAKFKAKSTDSPGLNHKHSVPKGDLIKIMKASGLPYFELGGVPYIHWSMKGEA